MAESTLQQRFNQKLDSLIGLARERRLAVAVSGGSDSMALALLARHWAAENSVDLEILTVDHGLRPASKQEAVTVGGWMKLLDLPHASLVWDGPHPTSGIQNAAREARYRLMAAYCKARNIQVLLLGHQLEDQLETFLMRFSKGSGLEGLASMREESQQFGIRLLRPLLGFKRQELRDFLTEEKQSWLDDPSNENPQFTRTQIGPILSDLQALPGSSLETIALSVERVSRASIALQEVTTLRFDTFCRLSPYGFIQFPSDTIPGCPKEVGLRLLVLAISSVRGEHMPVKLQSLENIYERLFERETSVSETIAGVQISKFAKGWLVSREPGRRGLPEISLAGKTETVWDQRFQIIDTAAEKDRDPLLLIKRIGPIGWRHLQAANPSKAETELPAKVRNNLPAVWLGDRMVAAPLFSPVLDQSVIAKDRFKMVFKALI
ncbi:tRNA lysidine(34) synthetase TilS [Sneathiella marina]|uniref:tRNA(Ile)-lysidine synthase n=1 Tax=Sneathiella marina TaxID=2950108 RepID=A0ABY4WBT3_9PROT|nr:tRNA lysidine(34) synthetase TilS [Sneathiella marina]USG62704.1 tRNA lysidine(34) synthetase TilS [Sneathiella marina]